MNNRAEFPLSEIGRPPLEPAALSALLREALALRGLSPERAGPTDWYRAAGEEAALGMAMLDSLVSGAASQ